MWKFQLEVTQELGQAAIELHASQLIKLLYNPHALIFCSYGLLIHRSIATSNKRLLGT